MITPKKVVCIEAQPHNEVITDHVLTQYGFEIRRTAHEQGTISLIQQEAPDVLLMESRPVAEIGLRALDAGRPSVVPGLPNQATAFSNRVLPRSFFPWLAYKLLKR